MPRASFFRRLVRARSGVAMVEFAMSAPLLLVAGLWGTETAWLALTNLRISQTAMQLADNGSRIGDTSTLQNRRIYEADINDIFIGAGMQGGSALKLFDNGRVILSSLEVDPASTSTPRQYIHWQRCLGRKHVVSAYGPQGYGLAEPGFRGMGPNGKEVSAIDKQDAIIYVEIEYTYKPLFSNIFVSNPVIRAESSFAVRESRDLSQVYQTTPAAPVASCDKFTSAVT